ncbi:MAG: c-type cytochrome, partial [Gemmatales bacterium]|nr:c-type cytochrome [Gemmatales bacterium]MDW8176649.1 c-type cytochrome [Gemmatales bacterium]
LEGPWASWATVFGPVVVLLVLFVLPLAGRGRARWLIHCVSVVLLLALATAIAGLTAWAWWNDYGPSASAEKFQEELHKQRDRAQRAIQLAARGIPVEGPAELLRRDPRTRGRELYQTHCATCHGFGTLIPVKNAVAPDLHNFGTQDWIYQLLQRMRDETSVESQVMPQMASWLRREYERAARADARAQKAGEPPQATARLEEDLKRIAAWLAAHPRRAVPQEGPQRQAFEQDTSAFARGYLAYETHCLRCHVYSGIGGGDTNGPDLTGYGDADWLRGLLHAPYSRQYYGPSVVRWSRLANPRSWMPAFRDTENANAQLWQRDWERTWNELEQMVPENDEKREQRLQAMRRVCTTLHLSELDRELIIRFVLNDDRLVFGGPAVLP